MLKKQRLNPASDALMTHYRLNQNEHDWIAGVLAIARFSPSTMGELKRMIGENEAILVESISRVGNFADVKDLADLKQAVSSLLLERGTRLRPGKRPNMGLEKLVSSLAPVFIYFGMPSASSERSRLVTALRLVADEMNISGDPRDEVRRLLKLKSKYAKFAEVVVCHAIANGLNPLSPKK